MTHYDDAIAVYDFFLSFQFCLLVFLHRIIDPTTSVRAYRELCYAQ